jgi:IclR helix-turn-helix domain
MMLHRQSRVTAEQIRERLKVVRLYLALTRTIHELAFPKTADSFGAEIETLLVTVCVFIGDAEGRPMTASKIAIQAGLPRASVYRRLERLTKLKKIVRVGRTYHFAENALTPDENGRLRKILAKFVDK